MSETPVSERCAGTGWLATAKPPNTWPRLLTFSSPNLPTHTRFISRVKYGPDMAGGVGWGADRPRSYMTIKAEH